MASNLSSVKIRSAKRRGAYHHGNLREALVATAIKLLEKSGPDALSLRAVAAKAGVSPTAPYAHFKDKQALLAAVAEAGYERLLASMRTLSEDASNPGTRFLGIGRGYVAFAREEPGLFRLMFSSALGPLSAFDTLQASADAAYGLFVEALDGVSNKRAFGRDSAAHRTAAWSLIHGLATLLVEKRLPIEPAREVAMVDAVTDFYLRRILAAH